MPARAAARAIIRIRTAKKPPARIVNNHLVQITVGRAAKTTDLIGLGRLKRMVIEIQADDLRIGPHFLLSEIPELSKETIKKHTKTQLILNYT